jgi:excisionase family DNA binding protein
MHGGAVATPRHYCKTASAESHRVVYEQEGRRPVDDWQILTVEQVAKRVQLSSKTVMRAIRAGDLEASQLTQGRGGWRIRDDAIARWLEARSNRVSSNRLPDVRRVEAPGPHRPPSGSTATQGTGRLVA